MASSFNHPVHCTLTVVLHHTRRLGTHDKCAEELNGNDKVQPKIRFGTKAANAIMLSAHELPTYTPPCGFPGAASHCNDIQYKTCGRKEYKDPLEEE